MKKRINNRGDTIIEVMICIAIVSLVLGASYALADNSTQANRQSQERGEALRLTESQMEQLKAYLALDTNPVPGGSFCMKEGVVKSAGTPDCQNTFYSHSISESSGTFTAVTNWERVGGGNVEEIRIPYRLHR